MGILRLGLKMLAGTWRPAGSEAVSVQLPGLFLQRAASNAFSVYIERNPVAARDVASAGQDQQPDSRITTLEI